MKPTEDEIRHAAKAAHTAVMLLRLDLRDDDIGANVAWRELEGQTEVIEAAQVVAHADADRITVARHLHDRWVYRMQEYGWRGGPPSWIESRHPWVCSFEEVSRGRQLVLVLFVDVVRAYLAALGEAAASDDRVGSR